MKRFEIARVLSDMSDVLSGEDITESASATLNGHAVVGTRLHKPEGAIIRWTLDGAEVPAAVRWDEFVGMVFTPPRQKFNPRDVQVLIQTMADRWFIEGMVIEITLVPDGEGLRMRGYKPVVSVRERR